MNLKKYIQFAQVSARKSAAYRSNTVVSIMTSVFYLALAYYIWRAISLSGSLNASLIEIMSYIVLSRALLTVTRMNLESWFEERIIKGTITNELKRPVSLLLQTYFNFIGEAAFRLVSRALPIFFLGLIIFDITFPTLPHLLLFFTSSFLAFNLVFFFTYLFSMFIFWTKSGWSIRMVKNNLQRIFSGAIFPLFLLPENLKPFFYATPFPAMIDYPISIFRMTRTGPELYYALGIQVFWILIMFILGKIAWGKAKNKLTVQGG